VRGIRLANQGDEVISLSILHRGGMKDQDEREDYLRYAPWKGEKEGAPMMTAERFAELAEREQFILTVCANGYGKISSAYEYRRTGRGGQGITNIDNIARNGPVVASFRAAQGDQLMLVTNQAKLIRMKIRLRHQIEGDESGIRVIGRNSAGVRLFNVAEGEHVVSAARIEETEDDSETEADAMVEANPPEIAPGGSGAGGDGE
jgi:DNA gyrase subunit A